MIEKAREVGCNTMVGAGMFDAEAEILVDFMLGQFSKWIAPHKFEFDLTAPDIL